MLDRKTLGTRGLFDPQVVQKILTSHDQGREDYTDLILVLMNLELWARIFLDGRDYADVAAEMADLSLAA